MFKPFVAATCALALSSCVQHAQDEEISVAGQEAGGCVNPVKPSSPVPQFVSWNGTLPAPASSADVWMIQPYDAKATDWALYQLDVNKNVVVTRIKLSPQQRQEALHQVGLQLATLGGVRVGGPIPGPLGGDPECVLGQAIVLRNIGM